MPVLLRGAAVFRSRTRRAGLMPKQKRLPTLLAMGCSTCRSGRDSGRHFGIQPKEGDVLIRFAYSLTQAGCHFSYKTDGNRAWAEGYFCRVFPGKLSHLPPSAVCNFRSFRCYFHTSCWMKRRRAGLNRPLVHARSRSYSATLAGWCADSPTEGGVCASFVCAKNK